MRFQLIPALLLAATPILSAQQAEAAHKEHAKEAAAHDMMDHGVVKAVKPLYDLVRGVIVKSAEQMPEANYAFKPTPDVRSFGELLGHIANAGYLFCSAAIGEKSPNAANFEKTTAKADLVKALNASFTYCDKAYQMSDMKSVEEVEFFGQKNNRLYVLTFNVGHNFEHYGNIVTYLRLKGLVPPSSQGN